MYFALRVYSLGPVPAFLDIWLLTSYGVKFWNDPSRKKHISVHVLEDKKNTLQSKQWPYLTFVCFLLATARSITHLNIIEMAILSQIIPLSRSGQSGGVARTGQMAVWPEMLFTQVPVWFIIPMNTIVLSIINHRIQPQPYLNWTRARTGGPNLWELQRS